MSRLPRSEFKKYVKIGNIKLDLTIESLSEKIGKRGQDLHRFFSGGSNDIHLALDICRGAEIPIRLAYETCGLPIPDPEPQEAICED